MFIGIKQWMTIQWLCSMSVFWRDSIIEVLLSIPKSKTSFFNVHGGIHGRGSVTLEL